MSCSNVKENKSVGSFKLEVEDTGYKCPIGEKIGQENQIEKKIPVLSCEGACIRGEIARQSANILGKKEKFARACHGELFAVPDSAMAKWVKESEKVVLIDGCFLHCHARILKNIIGEDKLVVLDAMSHYKKYSDIFDIDDVPEPERRDTAHSVAQWVLSQV